MFRPVARMLILVLFVFLGTCKDSTSPPVPTTLTISASVTTLEALGATVQLSAQVLDKKGKVMTGVPISWSSSDDGVATVSSSGTVTAVSQGSVTITALAEAAQGTVSISVTQTPASLQKVQGDGQEGLVGEALDEEPTVKVLDSRSNPIPGVMVTFSVTQGGGTVSIASVASSSTGEATAAWTLGTDASQDQELSATAAGISAEFSATAGPGPAALLTVVSGNEQTGEALQALENALVVEVTDQYENPIQGVEVVWAAGTTAGSLTPSSGETDSLGAAESAWTLGPLVGSQGATAAVEGLGSASFSATAEAPPIGEITVTPADPFLEISGTTQLTAAALTAEGVQLLGITFTWVSSDPTTVSVTQEGVITGIQPGVATISAGYGGVTGTTTATVTGVAQQTGVRIEVPTPAGPGQTVQAELILNTANVPHAVGAVEITLEWDSSVLSLGDWGGFTSSYPWNAVNSTGRLRVVVSVPAGLTGELTILQFPFQIVGSSGSATDISLSVDRAISALTFLEIGDGLPGIGTRIEVN
jgi:uncharacterized protein YjdB